jgi:hypothetical protein
MKQSSWIATARFAHLAMTDRRGASRTENKKAVAHGA